VRLSRGFLLSWTAFLPRVIANNPRTGTVWAGFRQVWRWSGSDSVFFWQVSTIWVLLGRVGWSVRCLNPVVSESIWLEAVNGPEQVGQRETPMSFTDGCR
jgi:hypothetical protein